MWSSFIESLISGNKEGTVQRLADAIGITRNTLYRLRRGKENPRWETVELLAAYKGVDPNALQNTMNGRAA